ncbi:MULTISPECIES: deoxycytidine triphosphate deaminase [Nostocales]|jgi:deoxycytidine triphosphate deaminase|uniref:dCTP deaminase domain-containing protein n=1 Tax=Nostocales TaxID=1161 RepID=UPI00029B7C18|nr:MULTISPECIES: deoxycytidine triphosphate deaminase [Nostocales]MCE2699238.1 deoxycytidine triphosphate deaminase [Anabaena sp. 49633_E8]MDJ0502745.1 deoxycytidine triphosphate deaminase [Nostocales cyanobacterium LE14-WE4]AFW97034.1 deoxycytidine triphosphate deaminase [Anabaena sp. 90]MCE2703649.1 deoxycytidine triphosphate deaminase [Anabaena sp. 49633_E8]MTJ16744.1 deoxycytidine triphosphate deaminase [Dolichospermum sp. UHCC 0299]
MSALSDRDIKRELGKDILIYPFNEDNLKGASYNLTASKLAWKVQDGKSAYDSSINKIIIPANSTVLIQTNEAIWVSKKIAGTYHSKVSWVSQGMGHIGTTLDPDYKGVSLIAVHNHNNKPIELDPEKDTFVSLMFYYLKTKSSIPHTNDPGRPDILKLLRQVQLTSDESRWLEESFRKDTERLRKKLKESDNFKIFKKDWLDNLRYLLPYIILILLSILSLCFYLYLDANSTVLSQKHWYNTVSSFADRTTYVMFGALIALITSDLRRS